MVLVAFSMIWLLAFCTLHTVSGTPLRPDSSIPRVEILNGTVLGTRNIELRQDLFLGIPYAQPPINRLRFQRPQPLHKIWEDGGLLATEYDPFCRGVPLLQPGFTQQNFRFRHSEDCLTLNIVRPSNCHGSSKLPVLFWIHGGGIQDGGSGDPRYNMSFIVDESVKMGMPIIGVSINYRLSGWGFLGGQAINSSGTANLGLQDQRLALRWVNENIEAFGGDPKKVTIQGESSGALSVGYHLLAYGGQNEGLFRAAVAQSGGVVSPVGPLTLEEQEVTYNFVLNATGCLGSKNTLGCLRDTPVEVLDGAFRQLSLNPVIDGALVPDIQSRSLRRGRFAKVPLLIGSNKNEGTALASGTGRLVNSSSDFVALVKGLDAVKGLKSSTAQRLADAYTRLLSPGEVQSLLGTVQVTPNSTFGSLYGQASIYVGGFLFTAGRSLSTQIWSQYGVPAYSYRFDAVPNGISPEVLGASHYQEVAFVFKNLVGGGYDINPFAAESIEVARQLEQLGIQMTRMWISFVNTLTPNHARAMSKSRTLWPNYEIEKPMNLVFRLPNSIVEPDTYAQEGISRIIRAFDEIRV
ncbi:carotenoid ester lipase precursor [Fusarium albosuccineum]|uniref:Carboxylic ester hydrolase n=1 Tax=Fusarium albosuccineum TaxID=1237068 RepID=A0A8H4P7T0_9HYPO|nr:carotenoid ester lipase precursor [Fusarium albosuccineum]